MREGKPNHPARPVMLLALCFPTWSSLWYGAMVVGAVVVPAHRCQGSRLAAPKVLAARRQGMATGEGQPDALAHVLVALAAVLLTGRLWACCSVTWGSRR